MKIVIAILLTIITAQIAIVTVCLNKKLDKLIELNTPQSIKVIPPEHILEDNLL